MQKMEWQAFMRMDDGELDAGHARMLDLLNILVDPTVARDRAAVAAMMDRLLPLADRIFAAEMSAMAASGYRLQAWHQHQHDFVLSHMRGWQQRVADDWNSGTGANVFLTLVPMLFRHFGEADRRFGQHIMVGEEGWCRAA